MALPLIDKSIYMASTILNYYDQIDYRWDNKVKKNQYMCYYRLLMFICDIFTVLE